MHFCVFYVSLFVCATWHMCVCICVWLHVSFCFRASVCVYLHAHVFGDMCLCLFIPVCLCICMHLCASPCVWCDRGWSKRRQSWGFASWPWSTRLSNGPTHSCRSKSGERLTLREKLRYGCYHVLTQNCGQEKKLRNRNRGMDINLYLSVDNLWRRA